jgi:hypothetical protein
MLHVVHMWNGRGYDNGPASVIRDRGEVLGVFLMSWRCLVTTVYFKEPPSRHLRGCSKGWVITPLLRRYPSGRHSSGGSFRRGEANPDYYQSLEA